MTTTRTGPAAPNQQRLWLTAQVFPDNWSYHIASSLEITGELPVPVLRRLGVRTREEIDRELYALKALVGNFPRSSEELSAEAAFAATTE